MSVRLIANGGGSDPKLFGQPFPPDDVKAYWSMVPDDVDISAEWSTAFGAFYVSRNFQVENEYEPQPSPRHIILAKSAGDLAVWMRVISELCNGGR